MGAEVIVTNWGTWEELLLGGAVLRHGTRDWTIIAAELRGRTLSLSPYAITPEACKAKYEDLQQRYSGCTAWFEELKKRRVAELKKALEQSEDSIGSLESMLESLKADKNEKKDDCRVDNDTVGPSLHVPSQKLERVESSTKEVSKDGLSAGSFTHQTETNWSHECQLPAMSSEDMEISPEVSGSIEHEKILNVDKLTEGQGGCCKKRRGKRKRKDCGKNINEVSVRESDFSIDMSRIKESSTSNCGEVVKSSGITEENANMKKDGVKDMTEILDSVLEIKGASAFCRKHDSQKRARYRQLIRRHMDFDAIRSRISNKTINTIMELFRDMLLLANNALIFYSKNTRQYKSAVLMRDVVTKKLKENVKFFSRSVINVNVSNPMKLPDHDPSVKVESVHPSDEKIVVVKAVGGSNPASGISRGDKKPSRSSKEDSPSSVKSLHIKKGFGGPKKLEPATPLKEMKEKKRRRTK
ncbi:unnamed protein product [Lathyrus oleraceus]|uniref:Bromo domain-containing protein n=2 Tax=Pisum sativum TaxID=3888 RepID=A0A9D4ZWK5_PEA|nr:uncharacterized protein LOC127101112 isoform X1 [Pisum sativum]KAI5386514.1 hypothetical protein KIW84_072878 [Pisum sativum]